MFCPKCHEPVKGEDSYCSQCGCSLAEWGMESELKPEKASAPSPKKRAYWFYCIVAFTFMLMVWGFYSFVMGVDMLSSIAELQLKAIRENKLTEAYYELTSSEFRKENSLDQFKAFIANHGIFKSFQKIEIVKSDRDQKYGVVFVNLFQDEKSSATVKFEFIQEEGEWRILSISSAEPALTQKVADEAGNGEIVDAVKQHLAALESGELDRAYSMGANDFLQATPPESFKQFIKEHPALSTDRVLNMSVIERAGNKVLVRVLLSSNGRVVPIDYIMVFEGGAWKVWSFYLLTVRDNALATGAPIEDRNVAAPVEAFLKELHQGQLAEAYQGTAKKFQQTTSFEQFQEFLKKFPIFTQGESALEKSKISDDLGQVRFSMKSGGQEAFVDYILFFEEGSWKILGIEIVGEQAMADKRKQLEEDSDFDTSFLTKTIKGQLEQIKKSDFAQAYDKFTSEKFREFTNLERFTDFAKQNRIFANNSSLSFGALTFDNNIATLLVEMTSDDHVQREVEYDLVKEGDEWRVLSIKIIPLEAFQE